MPQQLCTIKPEKGTILVWNHFTIFSLIKSWTNRWLCFIPNLWRSYCDCKKRSSERQRHPRINLKPSWITCPTWKTPWACQLRVPGTVSYVLILFLGAGHLMPFLGSWWESRLVGGGSVNPLLEEILRRWSMGGRYPTLHDEKKKKKKIKCE